MLAFGFKLAIKIALVQLMPKLPKPQSPKFAPEQLWESSNLYGCIELNYRNQINSLVGRHYSEIRTACH